jgi:hypothetical protein
LRQISQLGWSADIGRGGQQVVLQDGAQQRVRRKFSGAGGQFGGRPFPVMGDEFAARMPQGNAMTVIQQKCQ